MGWTKERPAEKRVRHPRVGCEKAMAYFENLALAAQIRGADIENREFGASGGIGPNRGRGFGRKERLIAVGRQDRFEQTLNLRLGGGDKDAGLFPFLRVSIDMDSPGPRSGRRPSFIHAP